MQKKACLHDKKTISKENDRSEIGVLLKSNESMIIVDLGTFFHMRENILIDLILVISQSGKTDVASKNDSDAYENHKKVRKMSW